MRREQGRQYGKRDRVERTRSPAAYEDPAGNDEHAQIRKKSEHPAGYQPVQEHVMRPVEPRLLAPERRLIVLRKNIGKTFLPPAGDRALLPSAKRHFPNGESGTGRCLLPGNAGKAVKNRTLPDERRVFHKKENRGNENDDTKPAERPSAHRPPGEDR